LNILQDPTRIFNGDGSGFQLCPKAGEVLACKGKRNVYEFDRGPAKASIRAMFAFSASKMMCLHMIIYPYQRVPYEITKTVPDGWGVGHIPTGWMIAEVFYEYTEMFSLHTFNNTSSLLSFSSVDTAPI
jgi:hypothetical protein